MAEKKRSKNANLLTLFVRGIDGKRLPPRDKERYLAIKKERAALEKAVEDHEHEIEEAEGPIILSRLKSAGVSVDQEKKALDDTRKARARLRKELGENYLQRIATLGSQPIGIVLPRPRRECTDINVHVCQEWVCVDQKLPMPVNDISTESGFDGSFTQVGSNGFQVSDSVEGWSSWNFNYHRHARTHDGKLVILAGVELAESTRVKGVGMRFEYLSPGDHGAWAHGKDPIGKPPSYGHVKAWYEIMIRYLRPEQGQSWVTAYNGAETKYLDWGPIESNLSGHPNFFDVSIYSDPSMWSRDLFVGLDGTFPPGTLFTMEVELSYWIKGNGEEGEAAIYYSMKALPYILMEACSYQYPESITLDLGDYL